MRTLGFSFKPWREAKTIPDGPSIALAGRPGLHRQAGGGDRQWSNCRNAGPGNGPTGRPRYHASALSNLYDFPPLAGASASWLYRRLPEKPAAELARWKSNLLAMAFYTYSRRWPGAARRLLLRQVQEQLGLDYDVETHFAPRYNPWDQRLCVVPDADLFTAIKSGAITVVTGQIDRFTQTGIRLSSGEELPADIIVTATGLALKLLGGAQNSVDGVQMDQHGYAQCTPRLHNAPLIQEPVLNLTSGYVLRAMDKLPR